MDTQTIEMARELWNHLSAPAARHNSDACVVCCSYDLRVCDHACELITSGLSDRLVISGKTGNWTRHIWSRPEAEIFYDRALANGMDPEQVLMEASATNFGENVVFSRTLIPAAKTVTFVSKPNAMLRIKLTAEAQWPEIKAHVSCPTIRFPEDISNIVGVLGLINEMVGDIDRIQNYPALGFQVPHQMPQQIIDAWKYLKEQGFTEHVISNQKLR